MLGQSDVQQDLRDAVIFTIYKNKGGTSDCSNYREITLLSIAGKIMAQMLLNTLIPQLLKLRPCKPVQFQSQHRHNWHGILTQTIVGEIREQNKGLYVYVTFIDLTTWFFFVQQHKDRYGHVRLQSDLSDPFWITSGGKQECFLAPILFSVFFSMILKQALEVNDREERKKIRPYCAGSSGFFSWKFLRFSVMVMLLTWFLQWLPCM